MKIVQAKREKIKVPILLMGASGSGKTLSSLLIAKGMIESAHPKASAADQWKLIGMIDTEHKRSNLYVDTTHDHVRIGDFTKVDLEQPFTSARYEEAFNLLLGAGCEVIIIDSISSSWVGEGGIQDQVDKVGGIAGWKQVAPEQRKFLHLLTNQDVHVIATARSKQGIEVTRDDVGKAHVEKVGLKIEQKDSLEYEFAVAFQLYENHIANATKDNSSIFVQPLQLNRDVGAKIYAWADKGEDVIAAEKQRVAKAAETITQLVANSEAGKKQLARSLAAKSNLELTKWTFSDISQLYVQLQATVTAEQQAQSKENN